MSPAPRVPETPQEWGKVSFPPFQELPVDTWIRLIVWMVIGLAIYMLYGAHHSVLGAGKPPIDDLAVSHAGGH